MATQDVALFVDWDNLKISLGSKGQSPTVSRLWELAEEHGRLVVAKAYADWSSYYELRRDQFDLYVQGIEPVFVPCRAPGRGGWIKNSVDVKMSADCLDVSYLNANVGVFVLVSGDADFLHVAESLRRRGLKVVVIGVRGSTSARLGEGVDARVFYDDAPLPTPAATDSPAVSPDLARVFGAVRRLLGEQRATNSYPVPFTRLKTLLQTALENGFDEKDHGVKKFKQFALAAERAGVLRIVTRNLVDLAILPEDDVPAEMASPSATDEAQAVATAEKEPLATPNPLLTDLVCTYVEIALANLGPFITIGRLQQFAAMRGRQAEGLPQGFTHAEGLEGLSNTLVRRHIGNAIRQGVFLQEAREGEGDAPSFFTMHLNEEHPIVREVLDRPAAPEAPPGPAPSADGRAPARAEAQPILDAIREVLTAQKAKGAYPVHLGGMKGLVKARLPDLDEKDCVLGGFPTYTRFMEEVARRGGAALVKVKGLDAAVLPEDGALEYDEAAPTPSATTDALLRELARTMVEMRRARPDEHVSTGRLAQSAVLRGKEEPGEAPDGLTPAEALRGMSATALKRHISEGVSRGVFLRTNEAPEGAEPIHGLRLNPDDPLVIEALSSGAAQIEVQPALAREDEVDQGGAERAEAGAREDVAGPVDAPVDPR